MTIPKINSAHGSDTRNILNRAIDLINVQGKSIQDLVAEGQLTPTQYANLIQTVNGFVSKGEVSFEDIDINKGKLLPKHLSEEVLKMLTGDAPINAVPADRSITEEKYALKSVNASILSDSVYKNIKSPVLKVDVTNAILNGEVYSKILRGFYDSNFKVSNGLEFDEIIIESIFPGDPIGSPTIRIAALKGDTVTTIVPKMIMTSIETGGAVKFSTPANNEYISGYFLLERDIYLDIYSGRLTYSNSTSSNILKLNKKTVDVNTVPADRSITEEKFALKSVGVSILSDSVYKNVKSPVLKVDVPNAILNGEVYSKILRGFYDSNFKVSNGLEFDEIIIESIFPGDPIGSPTIRIAALKGDTITTIVPKLQLSSLESGGNMKCLVPANNEYISGYFLLERDIYLDIYNGRLTYSNSTPSNILKLNKNTIEVERPSLTSNNDLSDYKAALLGSSSIDSRYERKTFMDWISERTGLQLLHYARGASSTTSAIEDWENENATYTSGLQKTKELIDDNPELDLILCQPLISDEYRPLGEWESTSATTCYGAMHLIAKMILETYPGKPFGFITGQYIAGDNKARESLRHQCIKEIGHYYGIPVLDLRGEGLTPYVLDSFKTNYVPDGTHLNDEGAKIASRRVEAFVNMLLTGYEK